MSMFLDMGGRVGIVFSGLRKGNQVVVMYGSGTPSVFRSCRNQWLFVGDCHVDGLMQGERITRWQEGELEEQMFQIV